MTNDKNLIQLNDALNVFMSNSTNSKNINDALKLRDVIKFEFNVKSTGNIDTNKIVQIRIEEGKVK